MWAACFQSGANRARTDDLLHAMQALSQLSYSPLKGCSLNRGKTIIPASADFAKPAGCDHISKGSPRTSTEATSRGQEQHEPSGTGNRTLTKLPKAG